MKNKNSFNAEKNSSTIEKLSTIQKNYTQANLTALITMANSSNVHHLSAINQSMASAYNLSNVRNFSHPSTAIEASLKSPNISLTAFNVLHETTFASIASTFPAIQDLTIGQQLASINEINVQLQNYHFIEQYACWNEKIVQYNELVKTLNNSLPANATAIKTVLSRVISYENWNIESTVGDIEFNADSANIPNDIVIEILKYIPPSDENYFVSSSTNKSKIDLKKLSKLIGYIITLLGIVIGAIQSYASLQANQIAQEQLLEDKRANDLKEYELFHDKDE